jgi:hypothetical protein
MPYRVEDFQNTAPQQHKRLPRGGVKQRVVLMIMEQPWRGSQESNKLSTMIARIGNLVETEG